MISMKKKKAKQRAKHTNAKEQLVYNREPQVAFVRTTLHDTLG